MQDIEVSDLSVMRSSVLIPGQKLEQQPNQNFQFDSHQQNSKKVNHADIFQQHEKDVDKSLQ